MTKEQIQEARRKFLGTRLWQQLEDVEDGAPCFIEIDVENGYRLELTLGDLRALKADLERNDASDLLAACGLAAEYLTTIAHNPDHLVLRQLRAAIAKATDGEGMSTTHDASIIE
jgi:hypothetical protein